MDAGLVAALAGARDAALAALEVDEMHVPHVADAVDPAVIVLLNLSRDQLDRVGEINHIERTLRGRAGPPSRRRGGRQLRRRADDLGGLRQPERGVGRRGRRLGERLGELPALRRDHRPRRQRTGTRPEPISSGRPRSGGSTTTNIYGPDGLSLPMTLALPGTANRGNAAQAVAAAVALGADPAAAVAAASRCRRGRGPLPHRQVGAHTARMLLAKNPAGWQEALSMVDTRRAGVVIAVNGQVPDGEDLSWLWDVRSSTSRTPVVAAGERGTDLAVRLSYAGVEHTLVHDTVAAIASCPPGHVEVVANYTAFLQLNRRAWCRG